MDSIIFDVDGTLWDSTDRVAQAWILAAKDYKVPYKHITGERLKKEFGKTMEAIAVALYPQYPAEYAIEITRHACDIENNWLLTHPVPVYDGVFGMMETLSKKIPLFIVSNCQAGYIEVLIETNGLGPFVTAHLCPGDTGNAKAANIRTIVDKYNLKSPVYVGDTAGDLAASKEAGTRFVFASYGFGSVAEYDAVISRPAEMTELYQDGRI